MALSAPTGYSASNLVFDDTFSGTSLDTTKWNPYITSNAANGWPWNTVGNDTSGVGGPNDAEYDTPSQVSVNNGLTLTAVRQSIDGMNQGSSQTFPVTSGVISSYGKFEFTGGYLQISMKAPSGDGAWPALWLLPGKGAGSSGDNFEVDLQEGGMTGSGDPNHAMSYHLHTPAGTFGGTVDTGVDLTSGYNTYGINWVPGQSITWYLNGTQIGQITSAQAPIPNEPMELIMSNQVANSNASGWHTSLDSSTPSSMAMQVGEVQLYQLPGSGNTVMGGTSTSVASAPSTTQTSTAPATTTTTTTTDPVATAPTSTDTAVTQDPTTQAATTTATSTTAATTTTAPSTTTSGDTAALGSLALLSQYLASQGVHGHGQVSPSLYDLQPHDHVMLSKSLH